MSRKKFRIFLLASAVAMFWCAESRALAGTKPTEQPPATSEQPAGTETEVIPPAEPAKVKDLAAQAGVAPEQVTALRTAGLGWGEVKIAISLAQKISTAEKTPLPIAPILDGLLAQRQSGMGWGQIAQANGFKLGEVVGKGQGKKDVTVAPTEPTTAPAPSASSAGTGAKPEHTSKVEKPQKIDKPVKVDKVERPEKPQKPEKLEKPEKPEKPARAEKPERPEKPEKPQH